MGAAGGQSNLPASIGWLPNLAARGYDALKLPNEWATGLTPTPSPIVTGDRLSLASISLGSASP
jgi:hypothetical protein